MCHEDPENQIPRTFFFFSFLSSFGPTAPALSLSLSCWKKEKKEERRKAMQRYLVSFSYIGTHFSGVAAQRGNTELRFIQTTLEAGLETFIRHPVKITLSSRTDAGVHALMNTFHVDLTRTKRLTGEIVRVCWTERKKETSSQILLNAHCPLPVFGGKKRMKNLTTRWQWGRPWISSCAVTRSRFWMWRKCHLSSMPGFFLLLVPVLLVLWCQLLCCPHQDFQLREGDTFTEWSRTVSGCRSLRSTELGPWTKHWTSRPCRFFFFVLCLFLFLFLFPFFMSLWLSFLPILSFLSLRRQLLTF